MVNRHSYIICFRFSEFLDLDYVKINTKSSLYLVLFSARYNKGHLKVCLTLIFKVNYGGQVTYISHIEIPNIVYVQIDTHIVSLSRIQPIMNKGSQ